MSNNRIFKITFLLIITAELLSFLGYYWQIINFICFFIIALLALILSLRRPEYGLYILLTELFIGSFGYLFYFENGGFKISSRIALWLIVMSVWLAKTALNYLNTKKLNIIFFRSAYFKYFIALFIFLAWGAVNGLLNSNTISNIFFDFNNWLYLLLIFPLYEIARDENNLKIIKQIFLASISWLSFKTLILAYFFSHSFDFFNLDLYRWVRLSGAGEITQVVPGFSRIFMQSHIYVLIGFFIILFYLLKTIINASSAVKKFPTFYLLLLTLSLSAIIISFSRSFWLGLAAGGIFVWLIALGKLKIKLRQFLVFNSMIFLSILASLTLTLGLAFFPWPTTLGGFNATALLSDRATGLTGEAGASSRWQLLPPLWQEIKQAPIMGQGFGATVTYLTSDPRVLAASPSGVYTTYAFEWGWLDVWLKLGLLGLLAYLILFAKIIFTGLKINTALSLSLAGGLIILVAVNIFSPYVNHPLGIGYLLIAAAMVDSCAKFQDPVY